MRKGLSLLLCLCLILCGCSISGERIKEPVNFYYVQNTFDYQSQDGVIACEQREASGHRNNLSYLLALYHMGPSSEELRLPFPKGTAIIMMEQTDSELKLALGSNAANLSSADFSLACACLTLTCTELVDVKTVTVTNGQQTLSMTRDSILLADSNSTQTTEETK